MKILKESLLSNAGLNKKGMIEKWLKDMDINNYRINPDMSIDINGDVNISFEDLKEIPIYIKFNKIKGNFYCFENELITLRGCPNFVDGWFDCSHNKLESLEYGPEVVAGSYDCSFNNLSTLKGCPKIIGSIFDCSHNKLESLEYRPEIVKSFFKCDYNKKVFDRSEIAKYYKLNKHRIKN